MSIQDQQAQTLQRIKQQIQTISQHEHIKTIKKLNNYQYHIQYHPCQTNSIYKQKTYMLLLTLPRTYPNDPPSLKFIDKIYHLNVGYNSGDIRMSILENDWSPFLSLTSLIESLDKLLEVPEQQYALDDDVLYIFQNNRDKYFNKVLENVTLSDIGNCNSAQRQFIRGNQDEQQFGDQSSPQKLNKILNMSKNRSIHINNFAKVNKKSQALVKDLRESMDLAEDYGNLDEQMQLQKLMSGRNKQGSPAIVEIQDISQDQTNKKIKQDKILKAKRQQSIKMDTAQSIVQDKQNQHPYYPVPSLQKSKTLNMQNNISMQGHKNITLHRINQTLSLFIEQLNEIQQLIIISKNQGIKTMLKQKYDKQFDMLKQLMQMSQEAKRKMVRKLKQQVSKL